MPITTAVASPRWIASTASFAATPNDAHAAIGAHAGPTILPSIEICDAGMLEMFHNRFGDTAVHGSTGQPYCLLSARIPFSFCRIVESFAEPDDGGTGSALMRATSRRYCASESLFSDQYVSQACFASIHSSVPSCSSRGSRGA